MRNFTTFGIGGEAIARIVESERDLQSVSSDAFYLGCGSNLLVSDNGIGQPVVINRLNGISVQGRLVSVESGVKISSLAKSLAEQGLSGLEWAYMLPASVGGAIFMNAGAFGFDMSDIVKSVTVLRRGELITLEREQCGFSYRSTAFEKGDMIVRARLELNREDKRECMKKITHTAIRRQAQPKGKSAGCIYKTGDKSAGWYIERCGLKGKRSGDITVSCVHAGFFVNEGRGTAKQVLSLMDYVEKSVQDKFSVTLEREIKLVGEF